MSFEQSYKVATYTAEKHLCEDKNKTVKMLAPSPDFGIYSCIGEPKHHTRHKAATSCLPKLVKLETGSIKRKRTRKKYRNT